MRKLSASILAAATCAVGALPAMAGTSSATASATFQVVNQCSITGSNVNLGTFRTTDTLQTVANKTGYQDGTTYELVAGTDGIGTVPLGSVTCDTDTPYTISMRSNGWSGSLTLNLPGGIIELYPMVKRIGSYEVPDGEPYFNGFGKWASPDILATYSERSPLGTTANGSAQPIMGNIIPWVYATHTGDYIGGDEQLGTAGVYSASWVTTLDF